MKNPLHFPLPKRFLNIFIFTLGDFRISSGTCQFKQQGRGCRPRTLELSVPSAVGTAPILCG
jgi:hypothetical protein